MTEEELILPLIGDSGEQYTGNAAVIWKGLKRSLDKHYPSYKGMWYVDIRVDQGVVEIRNLALSGKMGFYMKIDQIDPEGRKVVMMAGELLERYRAARDKAIDIRDAIYGMKRNFRGEAEHDGS
jgi:hypothetical protein